MNEEKEWPMWVLVLIVVAVWLIIAKDWGYYQIPLNIFWVLVLLFGYASDQWAEWVSRYKMPFFVSKGCKGSFSSDDGPLKVSDFFVTKSGKKINFNWLVYGLGATKYPFPTKGKLSTCIVPDFQVDARFSTHSCNTMTYKIPFEKLPVAVYNKLYSSEDFNLKYVYFLALLEVCPNNPDNEDCRASTFRNIVSGYQETSDIQLVYKIVK